VRAAARRERHRRQQPGRHIQAVAIIPFSNGWALHSSAFANAQVFRSGASAEAGAIRLAQGFAKAGEGAEVTVTLRDGGFGKRLVIPALRAFEV
jgi:hypothetical protein